MAVDSSHTKTNDIVDSPGQQTAKQAILWNEENHDDLITDYNAHTHDNTYALLDGDVLDIDFTPTNYTPDATPAEASDVDDLAAHLYGIDAALALLADGDKLDIDWNPTNYTPDSTIAEADDADDLSAHLKGIDTAIGNFSSSSVKVLLAVGTATTSIANTEVDVEWDTTPDLNTTNVTINGTNPEEIEINTDGVYLFDVSVRSQGNNNVELLLSTYVDYGAGFVSRSDYVSSNYASLDADQDTGNASLHIALDLDNGEKVKFSAYGDADGTAVLMTAGTLLRVTQL